MLQSDIDLTFLLSLFKATIPQRGAEVRQLTLPIQQNSLPITKKDSATVTSPVEIKPVRIGDPKIRSKITFEVVTARVIESGGKKHVVRFLCFILSQRTSVVQTQRNSLKNGFGSIYFQKQFSTGILMTSSQLFLQEKTNGSLILQK